MQVDRKAALLRDNDFSFIYISLVTQTVTRTKGVVTFLCSGMEMHDLNEAAVKLCVWMKA